MNDHISQPFYQNKGCVVKYCRLLGFVVQIQTSHIINFFLLGDKIINILTTDELNLSCLRCNENPLGH